MSMFLNVALRVATAVHLKLVKINSRKSEQDITQSRVRVATIFDAEGEEIKVTIEDALFEDELDIIRGCIVGIEA